jgi:hypothetical protein
MRISPAYREDDYLDIRVRSLNLGSRCTMSAGMNKPRRPVIKASPGRDVRWEGKFTIGKGDAMNPVRAGQD